jgi:TRAP transporter 4TM/12TM fusion protein
VDEAASRFRRLGGAAGAAQRYFLRALPAAGAFYLLDLHVFFGFVILRQQYLALLLTLTLGAVFLSVPAGRMGLGNRLPWYDLCCSILGVAVGSYLVIFYPELIYTLGERSLERVILGIIAVVLVVEAARRILGWSMVILVGVFLLYARYADLAPGYLRSKPSPWERLFPSLYISNDALLGTPLDAIGTVVLAFVLFGQGLLTTGGATFLTQFCTRAFGRIRGGPAKLSVAASSLFGTISGSAVANVAVDGPITIPLMKGVGYRPHVAGAIEAVASNGGQIMPPIMGAAAFVMAEYLAKPYREVAVAAIVPALLYYVILYFQIDLEAAKLGLKGLPRDKLPPLKPILALAHVYIIPLLVVVYGLFWMNLDPSKCGLLGLLAIIAVAFTRAEGRAALRRSHLILQETGEVLLEVLVTASAAGIVVGLIMVSGLGFLLSLAMTQMVGGQLFPLLLMVALVCIVLGMGMGTVAVYVIVATLLGPAVTQLGIVPIAAHLFLFYFAMLSLLTPPVCVAAYAAAAIAGASPMRTGFEAMRLGAVAYIVPFVFVYSPSLLLIGSFAEVALAVITALAGTALLAVALSGFLFRSIGWLWRAVLGLSGIALLIPPIGPIQYSEALNIVGAAVGAVFIVSEWTARRAAAAATASPRRGAAV